MLVDNLPVFKQNLNKLIDGDKSIMYEAAYEASKKAYYEATKVDIDTSGQDNNDLKLLMEAEKATCEQKMENDAIKFAENFATDFCDILKREGFMDAIADEVDGHIKSMKIMINVLPTAIGSIISPMGPCTGALIIDDPTTATIQIM
jgi:hypothetical protein